MRPVTITRRFLRNLYGNKAGDAMYYYIKSKCDCDKIILQEAIDCLLLGKKGKKYLIRLLEIYSFWFGDTLRRLKWQNNKYKES